MINLRAPSETLKSGSDKSALKQTVNAISKDRSVNCSHQEFFGSLCGQARSNPTTSSDLVPIRSGNRAGLLAATCAEQFDGKMPLAALSSNGFISPS